MAAETVLTVDLRNLILIASLAPLGTLAISAWVAMKAGKSAGRDSAEATLAVRYQKCMEDKEALTARVDTLERLMQKMVTT